MKPQGYLKQGPQGPLSKLGVFPTKAHGDPYEGPWGSLSKPIGAPMKSYEDP